MPEFTTAIANVAKVQTNTEGGLTPALGSDASVVNGSDDTEFSPAKPGPAKVVDIESFRPFVELMAKRHRSGSMSRDDAISMVHAVACARKLDRICDEEQIQAVVEAAFPGPAVHEDAGAVQTAPLSDGGCPAGIITADQLQSAVFTSPMLVVPPFIAEGVTLLAGKPKLGKSWLMLDLATAVASGTLALAAMPVVRGQVLGLFLEDSERRLQARLRKLQPNPRDPWSTELSLTTQWSRLDQGGLADLETWCREAANPKLIMIDTLAKVRPSQGSRKSQYDLDYEVLTGLHRIAHSFQVAIIVAHHTRKADADDVFDTVSGTLGLTGAADTILVLSKRSGKVVLHARGRDIEESETALQFDGSSGRWITLGAAADVLVSDERSRIIAALDDAPAPMSPKELMLATGGTSRNAIDLMLFKMVKEGQIKKASRGKYVGYGKIGKKEPAEGQHSDLAKDSTMPPDLSDLSADQGRGVPQM
jgi:hypothetical protein